MTVKRNNSNAKSLATWKEMTYITRINSWFTPEDAANWLCLKKHTKDFIDAMAPMVEAAFLEITPMAQDRIIELLHWKKQVLDKDWTVVTLEDWDLSLRAAETILKYAWLWKTKEVVVQQWPRKVSLMDWFIDWEIETNNN